MIPQRSDVWKEFLLLARSTHRACDRSFNFSGANAYSCARQCFQPDERIQHWVPRHQFWTLVTVADAAGIRPQSCGLGEGDSWVAVTNQRLSHRAVGADLLRPPV